MHIPLKNTFTRASISKRLWMGAGGIAVFIGTLFLIQSVVPGDPHDEVFPGIHLKCDFIAFYTGGRLVREGHSADLYNTDKIHAFETKIFRENGIEIGNALGPWWNPPFYAWVFVPIAMLSYPRAVEAWVLINIVCAAIAAMLLCKILAQAQTAASGASLETRRSQTNTLLLVPVLMALSTPFIYALSHAQNTCTSLLLVAMVVVFWRQERMLAAGLVTGLLYYKPQLGAVLSAVLVLDLGWRSIVGISITGVVLLLASLALPGSLHDFFHQMPKNLHFVQCDVKYMWDRHVTFKAFWRLLLQGTAPGEPTPLVNALSLICMGLVGVALIWAAIRVRKANRATGPQHLDAASPAVRRDRLIAATIAATPLLMPFYFDYDQLLLAIPAVLFATDLIGRDRSRPLPRVDLALMRLWPVYYAWLMLNPDIALATHLNVGVLLLGGVAGLMIVRAARDQEATAVATPSVTTCGPRRIAA